MIETTMLPRPLRDHHVLSVIRALDDEESLNDYHSLRDEAYNAWKGKETA
jgi:hypothetical protein